MKLLSSPLLAGVLAVPLILGQCDTGEERAEGHYQSALELIEAGDVDRAMVEFRNVFRLNGNHRDARAVYARLLRERGDTATAYGQYLRLVEQYPEDVEGRIALAEMATASADWEEAERHATVARRLAPEDPVVRAVVTTLDYRAAIVSDDPEARAAAAEEARATLAQLEQDEESGESDAGEIDAGEIIARRVVINELLAGEDPQAAMPEIERALELDPGNLEYNELRLRLLIARGDTAAATDQLEAMYERFPENERLRTALIQWYMQQGDLEAAETFLRRLAEESESPEAAITVVQFLRRTQGTEAAMAELDRLIGLGRDVETFRAGRAVLNIEEGRTAEGVSELESIVEGAAPSDRIRDIRVVLARVYESQGNNVGARAQIESVLETNAEHVEALKMQARWQIAADQPAEAIATLRRALDRAPRDPQVLTLLAQAHERTGDRQLMGDRLALAMEASGQAPAETLRYARYLIAENRLTVARAALSDALRGAPENVDLALLLGQVHIGLEEWERAQGIVTGLREMDTEQSRAAANDLQNRLLVAQGRTDESIAFLQELIQTGEADVRAAALVVEGHLRAGRIDEAEAYLTEQIAANPDSPALRFLEAGMASVKGDIADARARFTELAAEFPTEEAPVRALYKLEIQEGDRAAATAVLDAALERMPDSAFLNWLKAGELERAEDFEAAIAVYDRLYERNRDNLVIANNLASLLTTHRDDEESLARAHAVAQRLRGLEVPQFQDTYGWIAYRRGQYDEALSHLEPAAAALSDNALVQYHLGMTYAAMERTEEARETLQRAIDLAEDSALPQFATARETLANLPETAPAED